MDPFDVEATTINYLNATHSRRTASIYSTSSSVSIESNNNDNNKENQDQSMNIDNDYDNDEDEDIDMNMAKKPKVNGGRINVPQKHQELSEMKMKQKLNAINGNYQNHHNGNNMKKRAFNFAFNQQINGNNGYNGCGVHSGPLNKRQRF